VVCAAAEPCDPPDNAEGEDDDGIYEWVAMGNNVFRFEIAFGEKIME
jgi:hypothetical protein